MSEKKVAIFHDYLNQYGGAERVLEELLAIFPQADIYTFVYDDEVLPQFKKHRVITSPVDCLPFARQRYQWYFWLFPIVIKLFNMRRYDLVIASTHAWGNGIRKQRAKLITYCHTPMRYIWDLYDDYVRYHFVPWWVRIIMPLIRPALKRYDVRSAQNPDLFIANSEEVRERIRAHYGKDAVVVHPPVKVAFFRDHTLNERDDYYITVARLKPYKRIDLVIQAFDRLGIRLVVVGSGPQQRRLRRIAKHNIEFRKDVSDTDLRTLYATARGYIHMAHEDFGMTMAEAQAAGTPVIAYGRGGAREIVRDGETGVLFNEQSVEALLGAVKIADERRWDREQIKESAVRFETGRFRSHLAEHVRRVCDHE